MFIAGLTLLISLAVTFLAWQYSRLAEESAARSRFEFRVEEIKSNIRNRMLAYEQVLRGGAGIFAASASTVDRTQWRIYVESLQIQQSHPGIQGIGYASFVTPAEKQAFIRRTRAEGFPDYKIFPQGERAGYTVVTFLEPFDARNRRAFGFDMASEPVRRLAIEGARDSGKTNVSGKVTLKQESSSDVQAGFLMYLPLYRMGAPIATIEQRRSAFSGVVYSPFRMRDLMAGILERDAPDVDLEIFDGVEMSAAALMYDGDSIPRFSDNSPPVFFTRTSLQINGHTWSLYLSSLPVFDAVIDRQKPRLVLLGGTVISFLFFAIVWSFASTRARALSLAHGMTATIRDHEAQISSIVNSVADGILTIDDQGLVHSFNHAAERLFGYTAAEAVGENVKMLMPVANHAEYDAHIENFVAMGKRVTNGVVRELAGQRKDGSTFPMDLSIGEMQVSERRMFTAIVRDISERKRAVQALQESEQRLNLALEGSGLALWDWNIANDKVYHSEQWAVILGDAPQKIVTTFKSLEQLVHPDDIDALRRPLYETLKGERPFYRVEHRVKTRDGQWRWVQSTGKVVERNAQGLALRMTGTNADITERKQAAEDLMRFKNVLDDTIDMIFMFDPDSLRFVYLNRGAIESMGYTRDELLGMTPYQIKPLIPEAEFRRLIAPLLSGEQQSLVFETVHRRKDGTDFPVNISLQLVREERARGLFVAIVHDISRRRESEEKLRTSAARIRAIVDTVIDGIITIDEQGSVETFNPAAERIFGYSASEVIGENVKMLMPDPYHAEHDTYLRNYRESGVRKIIGIGREVTGRRQDGTLFPLELSVSEMQLADRRMYTGIVRDITERKKIDRMKTEFVSTVSHELRTPLTSIRGSLGLIAGGMAGDLPAQAKGLVDIAYNNSERLVRLINDILDIEKIESGNMRLDLQARNLASLLRQSLEANAAYAALFGCNFVLENTADNAMVVADTDRFVQVMNNLLSNAAKFSPAGGVITVSAMRRAPGVRITVADQGSGIPEEFHSQVFQKFAQADSSDTRKKGGTGLGLSIAKAIAQKFGGDITFESTAGAGAKFFFDLPEAGHRTVPEGESVVETAQRQPRILICEDDADIALLLRMMLKQSGFESDIAASAAQAKQLLADKAYAAMTLDIMLPDQDGISLIRELRAQDKTRYLPIVVVSAKAEDSRAELSAGAFEIIDWLGKPIEQGNLIAALERAVRHPKGGRPRILHVEDDADVRQVLAAMLHGTADIVPAVDLRMALYELDKSSFDLVVLDVSLPDGSGLDLLSRINQQYPPVPVLIFSAQEMDASSAASISTALVKSRTSNKELLAKITALLEKNRFITGEPPHG